MFLTILWLAFLLSFEKKYSTSSSDNSSVSFLFEAYTLIEPSSIASLIILFTLFSLVDQIKDEKNTLTDKEIYLLQKLAKKK